jgi:hypothetical protein
MKQNSTSYLDQLRQDFHTNPINARVCLPDGSLAVVRRCHDTRQGRVYRVQGIQHNGRFRTLGTVSCWFRHDELRLIYHSVSLNLSHTRANSDTRNGATCLVPGGGSRERDSSVK